MYAPPAPAPFGVEEALEMIREIKGYPLLEGVRGGPVARIDLDAAAGSAVGGPAASWLQEKP